jgi:putative ABC transport system permease protein
MIGNSLKPAFRILLKDRGYTFLNVLGLTVGITFSLLLLLYVADELQYDCFHEKAAQIVRIGSHVKETENEFHWATSQFLTAATLKNDYPAEVDASVRIVQGDEVEFRNGEKRFLEKKFFYAGENIFSIFTFPMLEGDPNTALKEPGSLVVSRSVAEKYFGVSPSYTGRSLTTNRNETWKITGIIQVTHHQPE